MTIGAETGHKEGNAHVTLDICVEIVRKVVTFAVLLTSQVNLQFIFACYIVLHVAGV